MFCQLDIIKEICEEKGIQLECLSSNYILRVTKHANSISQNTSKCVSRHIYGGFWDLNSAAADRIACDKTACFQILELGEVPAIPHYLLSNPFLRDGFTESGQAAKLVALFDTHGKAVLKPNQGTKGQDIFMCNTLDEAHSAASAIFAKGIDVAVSPYFDIEDEYRVFFLNGEPRFAYGKSRIGANFQHNLSQGAKAYEIADPALTANLYALATHAATCTGITFASVDIARLPCGKLSVMEINSGVQTTQLLQQLPHLRPVFKGIYADALRLLLLEQ